MNPLTERERQSPEEELIERSSDAQMIEALAGPRVDTPLLAVIRLLWSRRVRLRKAILVSLVVGGVIAILIPNNYQASARLMPPEDNSGSSGMAMIGNLIGQTSMAGAGSGLLSDVLGVKDMGALYIGVMRSRTLEDRIIDRFDLRRVYWRKTYAVTREKLAAKTDITEDRKTKIITIMVSDRDRARATAIAQAYVEELNRLLAEVNTSAAHREREFLEQRLAVVNQELQEASKNLAQFSSTNTTLDLQDQGKAMVEAAAVLQGQLIAAQSELSGAEQIYTPENVRVRSLRARVAELQQQLNELGGKNYNGSMTLDPNSLYPSLKQLPMLGLQYAEFYRRVKVDETVFALLTEEYEMAKVEEAKETPSVKVLDAARLPEKPAWPPRWFLTVLFILLGFLLTCAWIVGSELWLEVDTHSPYKAFLLQMWSDTRPAIQSSMSRIRSRFSRDGNSSAASLDEDQSGPNARTGR